jgi:hypothetical protein
MPLYPPPRRISRTRRRRPRFRGQRLHVEPLENRQLLTTITVTTLSDGSINSTQGDGVVSLREAIHAANNNISIDGSQAGSQGHDKIVFDPSLSGTLFLEAGRISVQEELTVEGNGSSQTIIDAQQMSTVLRVHATANVVTLRNLTITGGKTTINLSPGGAINTDVDLAIFNSVISDNSTTGHDSDGGAIWAARDIFISASVISGNSTEGVFSEGGAIYAAGNVEVVLGTIVQNSTANDLSPGGAISAAGAVNVHLSSSISGNATWGDDSPGGAIYADTVTVNESTISGNTAGASGGGGIQGFYLQITNSTVSANSASDDGGGLHGVLNVVVDGSTISGNQAVIGGGISAFGSMNMSGSIVSGNQATNFGGGIYGGEIPNSSLDVVNSTISGNTAGSFGGGVRWVYDLTVDFSTIVGNSVIDNLNSRGGGIYVDDGTLIVGSSIIADNTSSSGDAQDISSMSANAEDSLIGYNSGTLLLESNPGPDPSGNIIGGPINGPVDPLLGPLASNGGPTETHALSVASPAIDAARNEVAPNMTDQRGPGYARNRDGNLDGTSKPDMGSFEAHFTSITVLTSLAESGSLGNVSFSPQDIAVFHVLDNRWSMYFDGSDVGLGVNVDAHYVEDDGTILMSFDGTITLPGVGIVDPEDIVRFIPTSLGDDTEGSFEMHLNGNTVGLIGNGADIDAIGRTPAGTLILSTAGDVALPKGDMADEDLLQLTSGNVLKQYFDGSDVGLEQDAEDVKGVWFEPATGFMFLTTEGEFDTGRVSGLGTDVLAFVPEVLGENTAGTFQLFELAMFGLPANMSFDGLDIQVTEFTPIDDGDFNDDGFYDCLDIDALTAQIAAMTHDPTLDLTGDGFVNVDDLDAWLAEGGANNPAQTGGNAFLKGDANLDGFVDAVDFIIWNDNKFTSNSSWCSGDFNADGFVEAVDFIIWNDNKFQSSNGANQIVLPDLRSDPHKIDDTRHINVNNDTIESASSVSPRVAPLMAKRVDSVFAMSRRGEIHNDESPKANSFENLGDTLPINSYLL